MRQAKPNTKSILQIAKRQTVETETLHSTCALEDWATILLVWFCMLWYQMPYNRVVNNESYDGHPSETKRPIYWRTLASTNQLPWRSENNVSLSLPLSQSLSAQYEETHDHVLGLHNSIDQLFVPMVLLHQILRSITLAGQYNKNI